MEIVYPRSCGVDVHKSFIVAVICISESVKPKYIKKRFSTFNNQLIQFRDWLIENNCQNVCMESTGKKKSVKISKAGVYLKPCLVQVAHAAVKDKNCDYYADKFNKISKRRGKKRAIIAIARKILTAVYHLLKTGEVFNPTDMADVETTKKQRIEYVKNNLRNAFNQLSHTGLSEAEILQLIRKESTNSPQIE